MGAVILKDIKEHAKYRKWKQSHIDPRNASRTPSASKEPLYRLRYESPIGASPSRHSDHQKPFYEDEPTFDRSTSYRGSVGRSIGNAPSYNGMLTNRSITNCYTFIILLFLLYFPYSFMFVCFFFFYQIYFFIFISKFNFNHTNEPISCPIKFVHVTNIPNRKYANKNSRRIQHSIRIGHHRDMALKRPHCQQQLAIEMAIAL